MPAASPSDRIRRHFELFAGSIEHLPLYHRLASALVDDPEVRDLLLAARPGQARPVLLLAAVHDLLLRRPALPLARWYASITGADDLAQGDPYPTFRATCLDHADELREEIATHSTQTNEVNRCVLIAPLLATAVADEPALPITLVELGCSAGLLLGLDRYAIDVGGTMMGDPTSPVRLAGELVGAGRPPSEPFPPRPPIRDRVGIDLAPVDLDDEAGVRWLEACLWPDQPHRVDRFRAAVELGRADQPRKVRGDFIDTLPDVVASLPADTHLVVFHGWSLTYVARDRRPDLTAAIATVAGTGRPVSWLSLEAPGVVPDVVAPQLRPGFDEAGPETVLGLRRWREGRELDPLAAGWSHPHGAWLNWQA